MPILKPRVSVIMSAYNGANFIKKSIDSVLSQTLTDFELIIINDGSTDKTQEIARGYRDNRIIYLQNKINQGVSKARNIGLKIARGEYIAYCDQDDIYYLNHLERFVSVFDNHPGIGLVYAKYLKLQIGKSALILPKEEFLKERELKYFIGPPVNVMHKAECLKKVGDFDESVVITQYSCEDRDLWLRISDYFIFYHLDDVLSEVVLHGKNRSCGISFHKSWRYLIKKRWRNQDTQTKRARFINNCGIDAVGKLHRCGYFKEAYILAREFYRLQKNSQSLACLGLCNMAKGKFKTASAQFEKSLKLGKVLGFPQTKENFTAIKLLLARTYFHLNKIDFAKKMYKDIFKLDNQNNEAREGLFRCYFKKESKAGKLPLTPKVSVIIPTFNREKFIGNAIKSVIKQALKNFELIIINDGSTDNTKEVVLRFNDKRIVYLEQKNGGPGSARNSGLKRALGEYIAYLDDDDIYYPDHLKNLAGFLDSHPKIGLVYSDCLIRYPHGKILQRVTSFSKRNLEALSIYFPSCAIMHRRSCFNKAGIFDEKLTFAQDFDMWLRISDFYNVTRIPVLTAERICHGENRSLNNLGDRLRIASEYLIRNRLSKAKKEGRLLEYINDCSIGVIKTLLIRESYAFAFLLAGAFFSRVKNYQTFTSLGLCSLSKADFKDAVGKLQKALKLIRKAPNVSSKQLNEDLLTIKLFLATAYLNLNKTALTIKIYQNIIRLDSKNIEARHGLSRCYIIKGYYNKALKQLKNMDDALTHRFYGAIYFAQGKYKHAAREFEITIEKNPNLPAERHNLVVTCAKLKAVRK